MTLVPWVGYLFHDSISHFTTDNAISFWFRSILIHISSFLEDCDKYVLFVMGICEVFELFRFQQWVDVDGFKLSDLAVSYFASGGYSERFRCPWWQCRLPRIQTPTNFIAEQNGVGKMLGTTRNSFLLIIKKSTHQKLKTFRVIRQFMFTIFRIFYNSACSIFGPTETVFCIYNARLSVES